jgi:hypothetical protein
MDAIAQQQPLNTYKGMHNGALLLTVADVLFPELADFCKLDDRNSRPRSTMSLDFLRCWEGIYDNFVVLANFQDSPVRIYPPLGGFWREHNISNTRIDSGPLTGGEPCQAQKNTAQIYYTRQVVLMSEMQQHISCTCSCGQY